MSIFRNVIACALAVLSVTASARADEPTPVWQGVWSGTIGTLPVRMCLRKTYTGRGFYYYRNRSGLIPLTQAADSRVWTEGDEARQTDEKAFWRFSVVGRERLSGIWQQNGRTLPFVLTPVANTEDGVCSSAAFNAARIPPTRIARKPAIKDGVRYTRLLYHPGPAFDVDVESFALPMDIANAARINALLAEPLPGPGRNDGLECALSGLEGAGGGGSFSLETVPTIITRRWLATVTSTDYYCGGAHPDGGAYPGLYDLGRGRKVDPLDWFSPFAVAHSGRPGAADDFKTLTKDFRALIIARIDGDPECNETVGDADFWDVGIDRKGFIFQPSLPHVAAGCVVTIPIPFATFRRFLSPAGRLIVASIESDIARRRVR